MIKGLCFRCHEHFSSQKKFGHHLQACDTPLDLDFILDTFNVTRGSTTECWLTSHEWRKRNQRRGVAGNVPRIGVGYRRAVSPAHAVAIAVHGPKPKGLVLTHTCDNIRCLNPGHLRWRTQADNVQDAWSNKRRVMSADHLAAMIAGRKAQATRLHTRR